MKEKYIDTMCELKDKLISVVEMEMHSGLENVDANELGEVVDMIKDLAEAKKYCCEAEYYENVNKAMTQKEHGQYNPEEEMSEEMRYGYNTNRGNFHNYEYPINQRMGYHPYVDQKPYIQEYLTNPNFEHEMMNRMGYGNSNSGSRGNDDMSRYGRAYNAYQQSRRYYTQTNSQEDKDKMEHHAQEHMADTVATIREIWKNAEPELRKRMKTDMKKLLEEMNE